MIFSFFLKAVLCLGCMVIFVYGDNEEAKVEFHYDKLEKLHDKSDSIVRNDLKVEKVDTTKFKINGEVQLLVPLDDDWLLATTIFKADSEKGEYKKILPLPKVGVCHCMKTFYKNKVYDILKDYSNAPNPETCPVPADTYVVKDYPFDGSKYNQLAKEGYYRIELLWSKKDETQMEYHVFMHVNKI